MVQKEQPWGTPKAGDATAEYEGIIQEVHEEIMRDLEEMGPSVLNRPIGSVKVPISEDHEEWERMKDDPNAWASLLEQRTVQVGLRQAIIDITDYDGAHQGMVKE